MASIAEILQALIDSEEGLNATQLAEKTGVPQPTIQRILAGKSVDPATKTLEPLARYFSKTVAQLRGEIPIDSLVISKDTGLPAGKYYFPMAYENVTAAQGAGRLNEEPHLEVEGKIAVPMALINERGWRPAALRVAKTDGQSMKPTLGEDESVVINLDDTKLVNGKIYAIEDDDGVRIKRLRRLGDGRIEVSSDNADKFTYPTDYITPESRTRIVARVVYRSGEL
jgi:phage repressor protein C with HTH and peptisase S24 domain